ncbi:antitoxin ParD1/3/4 [Variovorax sp. YR750]|jgi:antitoxin ParD1/3/4|uniref:Type II toxin-antitoxin system ParD family antitoxin n=2 Tax=Comamonadaceae TaxID=80864 RepID=A0A431THR1_9BURK|nr:type II toxin-antitoxin system ParD family antitoxin [Variovorax gossypii]SEM33761.1 antitoxin ParD1/3/4 [Variovorax sp. YR750]
MKAFVEAQVAERRYGNVSEYVRDLIRRDLEREQLRTALLAGLESGPSDEWTAVHFDALRAEIAHAGSAQASSSMTHRRSKR